MSTDCPPDSPGPVEHPDVVHDQDPQAEATASSNVHCHQAPPQPAGLDQNTANQLIASLITQAQHNMSLDATTARNLVSANGMALITGVANINAATLMSLYKISPISAAAMGLTQDPQPSQ